VLINLPDLLVNRHHN